MACSHLLPWLEILGEPLPDFRISLKEKAAHKCHHLIQRFLLRTGLSFDALLPLAHVTVLQSERNGQARQLQMLYLKHRQCCVYTVGYNWIYNSNSRHRGFNKGYCISKCPNSQLTHNLLTTNAWEGHMLHRTFRASDRRWTPSSPSSVSPLVMSETHTAMAQRSRGKYSTEIHKPS